MTIDEVKEKISEKIKNNTIVLGLSTQKLPGEDDIEVETLTLIWVKSMLDKLEKMEVYK